MNKPIVSIIIPAHNEEKLIGSCLSSILDSINSDEVEIIVVDNASSDATKHIASSSSGVRVFEESRKGVMHARQRGIAESSGDIIAFLDADNRISRDWIEKVEFEFARNPRLECLTGPYEYYDLFGWRKYLISFYWHTFVYMAYALLGYVGNFGNMAIKRSTLEKIGGLDTSIAFYGDDTATARNAARFGKVKYDLNLKVQSSGRRFAGKGMLKTCLKYAANFFSQILFKKSVSQKYEEYR